MGRRPQPEIRARLLEQCTDHALAHGLPDRLADLAVATGASSRMLLYHFGTKDALLREVLRRARARQLRDFGELLRLRPDEPYLTTLRRAWVGMTGGPGRRYLDVFGRLREDAQERLWPGFRLEATTDWLGLLEEGMAKPRPSGAGQRRPRCRPGSGDGPGGDRRRRAHRARLGRVRRRARERSRAPSASVTTTPSVGERPRAGPCSSPTPRRFPAP